MVQFVVEDHQLTRKAKWDAPLWAELVLLSLSQTVPIGQLA